MSDDPFEGISDEDISKYSELFEVPPPENDNEAKQLSKKIKEWANKGRPKPGDNTKKVLEDELKETKTKGEDQKPDKEEKKSKKKRGTFGLFRK
jgi:fused signal recognition particle receptor